MLPKLLLLLLLWGGAFDLSLPDFGEEELGVRKMDDGTPAPPPKP
jgi:hypothetical protein